MYAKLLILATLGLGVLGFSREAQALRRGALLIAPVGPEGPELAETADDLLDVLVAEAASNGDVALLPRDNAKSLANYKGPADPGTCIEDIECLRGLLSARQLEFFMVALVQKKPTGFVLEWRTIGRRAQTDGNQKSRTGGATADLIRALKQAMSIALVTFARASEAFLVIETNPAGATILLDGRSLGEAPLPRVPVVGDSEHVISARLEGHKSAERKIACPPGDTCKVAFELEVDVTKGPDVAAISAATRKRVARGLGWSSVGLGIASAAVSTVFFLKSKAKDDDLLKKCPSAQDCNLTPGQISDGIAERDGNWKVGLISAIGTGAFVVAGTVVLLVVKPPVDDEEASTGLLRLHRRVAVGVGLTGLSLKATF